MAHKQKQQQTEPADFVSRFSHFGLDATELRQFQWLYNRAMARGYSRTSHQPYNTEPRRAALIAGILDAVRKGRAGDRRWALSMIGKKRVKYKIAKNPWYWTRKFVAIGHAARRAKGQERKVCCVGPEWEGPVG